MDLLSLDRLPLPSLRVYTGLSTITAGAALYVFWKGEITFIDFDENINNNNIMDTNIDITNLYLNNLTSSSLSSPSSSSSSSSSSSIKNQLATWESVHWASQQPHCVWPLVNMVYCLLILMSHSVQKSIFGNLRASEQENVKDQFWNLVFYKVVFVFGVVNVQEIEDAVGWCFFVSVIGFLQLARQLCKERHNYLILMNDWTKHGEIRRRRIQGLLVFIFLVSLTLFISVCAWYMGSSLPTVTKTTTTTGNNNNNKNELNHQHYEKENMKRNSLSLETIDVVTSGSSSYDFNLGLHSSIFMLSEIGLLVIQTLHVLIVCLFDQIYYKSKEHEHYNNSNNNSNNNNEDGYSGIADLINFNFELIALLFDLVHHVHMLVCCNLFLSMTSLIVSLQMRARVRQIHGILQKRQSYIWLSEHIDQYPEANPKEGESDNCAICWDLMPSPSQSQKAKMLPCNHMFHTTCLRKWLLVSMNCPTCRLSLLSEHDEIHENSERQQPRRFYSPRPNGVWGFLHTGQTLLDLFGGWDPQLDEILPEAPSPPRAVSLFDDFGVRDWTVESQNNLRETPTPDTQKRD